MDNFRRLGGLDGHGGPSVNETGARLGGAGGRSSGGRAAARARLARVMGSGLTCLIYFQSLARIGSTRTSMNTYLQPLVACIFT